MSRDTPVSLMRLSYRNELPDYRKHHELVGDAVYATLRSRYHAGLLLPVGIGFLGFVGTFPHNPPLSLSILAGVAYHLIHALPYRKHYDRLVLAAVRSLPEKDITLEIRENGLLEIADGIESFCPWGSVEHFQHFQDIIFILLKSNLWAIIPLRYLAASEAAELVNILRSRNIDDKGSCASRSGS